MIILEKKQYTFFCNQWQTGESVTVMLSCRPCSNPSLNSECHHHQSAVFLKC